jgi:hypothetical protein
VEQRLPEPVEVSAYYVIAEALSNAAKHARASTVSVQTEVAGDALHLTVRDDGDGGAGFTRGTGLAGLKDRVEALGGRIFLDSPRGAGTSLRVELPLTPSTAASLPLNHPAPRAVISHVYDRTVNKTTDGLEDPGELSHHALHSMCFNRTSPLYRRIISASLASTASAEKWDSMCRAGFSPT